MDDNDLQNDAQDTQASTSTGGVIPTYKEGVSLSVDKGTIELAEGVEKTPQTVDVERALGSPEIQKAPETASVPAELPKEENPEPKQQPVEDISTIVPEDKIVDLSTHDMKRSPVAEDATKLTKYADEEEDEFIKDVEDISAHGSS